MIRHLLLRSGVRFTALGKFLISEIRAKSETRNLPIGADHRKQSGSENNRAPENNKAPEPQCGAEALATKPRGA